ncbi:hypothetical protein AB0436_23005 [Streptomyces sp. NPDC051322]|uniref:hypothetical protein n=1 Tax=Streptomyces sp. NPDC051322 TaxID=3154645 RepID=UPI00344E990F
MRKMRSSAVVLGGMGMLAATLTACGSDVDKRCVDPDTYKQLPKYECSDSNGHGTYYYGGSSRNGRISGGSFNKSSVHRGGFGGGFHSSGG